MKAGFYMTGQDLFNWNWYDPNITTTYYSYDGSSNISTTTNKFVYLKLKVPTSLIRKHLPTATLEVYNVVANMFDDGVRMFDEDAITCNKDFVISGGEAGGYADEGVK